ncbi:MAG: hypothetical protein K940chlam6_01273 [Chlamydiae bacterium]|nr:hypothetical protein [Chlamydiota bacterium]
MFKRKISFSLALLLPILGLWAYQMTVLRSNDFERYEKMIENREIASSNSYSPTNQERKQVRKDIWFSQDDCARLHYQIASESSLLTLTPVKNKFEVVETLDKIKCWMQDKLIKDGMDETLTQQARLIEAESGVYHHTSQEFIANDVTLSLFRLPGHQLPKDPINQDEAILRGIAHDISFYFSGKTPQFQARQFEATMVKE